MSDSSWQCRYVPKTNAEEWASRASRIGELYAELLPIMQEIQRQHPESVRLKLTDMDSSDGFMRLIDLVPNVQQIIGTFDGKKHVLALERLTNYYAPKTEPIFAEVNAMLKQYMTGEDNWEARREARRISDDLEWALRETYQAAETMQGRQSPRR